MGVLVLDESVMRRAKEVRQYAEAPGHWWDGTGSSPGDCDKHILEVSVGYKLAYTVDTAPEQLTKHLSISRVSPEGRPMGLTQMEVLTLANLFGFGPEAKMGLLPPDPPWVIHVIEPYTPKQGGSSETGEA